ncbi:unnamed protein product [Orchesella dallaii]|uniref:Uncharacterized protein n=1 Tax=Orchesella dallaii TaxID=48710 RepID=A0ABP1R6F5_9HEXA
MTFFETLSPSRTTFLFVLTTSIGFSISEQVRWDLLPVFTAHKFAIDLAPDRCDLSKAIVTYICNHNCNERITQLPAAFDVFKHPEALHKTLFQYGNRKVVPGITASFSHQFKFHYKDCLMLVKYINGICVSEITTMLHLASAHNYTTTLHSVSMEIIENLNVTYFYSHHEHIAAGINVIIDTSQPKSFSIHDQLSFENFNGYVIDYCINTEKIKSAIPNFKVWCEPFSADVWSILCLILVFMIVLSGLYAGVDKTVLHFLSLISETLGHGSSKNCFMIVYTTSFLFVLYGNCLLSSITTPTPQEGFKTLKQFFEANYKILYSESHFISPEIRYHGDFKLLGLEDYIKNAFWITPYPLMKYEILKRNLLIGDFSPLAESKFTRRQLKFLTQHSFPGHECFQLKETLEFTLYSWKFNMEIRDWLKTSMLRLMSSGLYQVWHKWYLWHANLEFEVRSRVQPHERLYKNQITAANILSLWTAFGAFIAASVILLATEIHRDRRKPY